MYWALSYLAYTKDLADSRKSRDRLFADDTIVFLTKNSQSDAQILQDDLLKLEQWKSDRSMEFNPDKCEAEAYNYSRGYDL